MPGPRPLQFPVRGAANHSTFTRTPGAFAPLSRLRNARLFTTPGDRPCMGTRPGHVKAFTQSLGGKTVQAMRSVARAKVLQGYFVPPPDPASGYTPCEIVTTGTSGQSAAPVGNLWGMDSVPSMVFERFEDVSDDGGDPASPVVDVAASPEGTHLAYLVNYMDGSPGTPSTRVRYITKDNANVWVNKISNADIGATRVVVGKLHVFVAAAQYVYCFRRDTGVNAQTFACNDWSQSVVDLRLWTDAAGVEHLFVAFQGSNVAATLASGCVVSAGKWANHYRGGVMKCRVADSYAASPVLTQEQFGPILASNNRYFEANHGYLRISEQGNLKPRGALVIGIEVLSDGGVAVITGNAGWGPDSSVISPDYFAPDLTLVPPINVRAYSSTGVLAWEQDTESWFEVGDGGFFNDLPVLGGGAGVTNRTSLEAIAADGAGDLYVGGRRSSAGYSAFKLRGSDGAIVWRATLMDASSFHSRGALAVDPTDGHPIFGGSQNAASGGDAHLFKLRAATGELLWRWKITGTIAALGVTVLPSGDFVYATDKL